MKLILPSLFLVAFSVSLRRVVIDVENVTTDPEVDPAKNAADSTMLWTDGERPVLHSWDTPVSVSENSGPGTIEFSSGTTERSNGTKESTTSIYTTAEDSSESTAENTNESTAETSSGITESSSGPKFNPDSEIEDEHDRFHEHEPYPEESEHKQHPEDHKHHPEDLEHEHKHPEEEGEEEIRLSPGERMATVVVFSLGTCLVFVCFLCAACNNQCNNCALCNEVKVGVENTNSRGDDPGDSDPAGGPDMRWPEGLHPWPEELEITRGYDITTREYGEHRAQSSTRNIDIGHGARISTRNRDMGDYLYSSGEDEASESC